jgi:hypothetical protein
VKILLETIHGSHLYGLATATSDRDSYRVIESTDSRKRRNVKQKISGDEDVITTTLSDFVADAANGNPKALEAMFSPLASGPLKAFADGYYLNPTTFIKHYHRIVRDFAYLGMNDEYCRAQLIVGLGDRFKKVGKTTRPELQVKYRRHATRLLLNMDTGLKDGRFNPVLSDEEKNTVYSVSVLPDNMFLEYVLERLTYRWDHVD